MVHNDELIDCQWWWLMISSDRYRDLQWLAMVDYGD